MHGLPFGKLRKLIMRASEDHRELYSATLTAGQLCNADDYLQLTYPPHDELPEPAEGQTTHDLPAVSPLTHIVPTLRHPRAWPEDHTGENAHSISLCSWIRFLRFATGPRVILGLNPRTEDDGERSAKPVWQAWLMIIRQSRSSKKNHANLSNTFHLRLFSSCPFRRECFRKLSKVGKGSALRPRGKNL
ncbi:hypothetical protein FHW16_001471 [Phyllobacterium myrsinacearum]|uniref:Uncharacterized protein n=1 Tax=Phyllobacterium myrsinacearum TaxID=28101 RepID=A0A839EG98_9HYPH|nr:hypothetical protein [Phyllobacterium myrsinacearum]